MPTLSELRKIAKSNGFIEKMSELGFEIGSSGLWLYRVRSDYIDYLSFSLNSSKNFVTVPVICLKASIIDHCDMSEFPKGFNNGIPFYSSTYINEEYGVEIGGEAWCVETQEDVDRTFSELLCLVQSSADIWFQNINTDQKFYDSFTINFKGSETAERIKARLNL
jgi:hypothetical protein